MTAPTFRSSIGIPATAKPALLGSVAMAKGSQMVAADEYGYAWVGDPAKAQLIRARDAYPATPERGASAPFKASARGALNICANGRRFRQ